MLPIKKLLPPAVPLGVNSSTTTLALAATVGGVASVAVNSVLLWLGTVTVCEPIGLRLARVKAPESVYNLTVTGCEPPPPVACSIPKVTVFIVNGPASGATDRSYTR